MAGEKSKSFKDCELVGEKVRLRPPDPNDTHVAYGLLRNDLVTQNILWDGPSSVKELAYSFRRRAEWWRDGTGEYSFTLERLGRSSIIGSISVRALTHPQQFSLGYWLGVPHWGKGYMSDAVRLATHFAFQHLDSVRAFATVFVGNIASRRVLEKNGYRLDSTLRSHVLKRNEWRDEWFFTLLRKEWESRQEWYLPQSERIALM